MTHTIGKMTVGGNMMDDCIKIRDELIGVIYPCESERKHEALANARRLASCWNACDGLDTAFIEGRRFADLGLTCEVNDQRDALLAALELLAKACQPVSNVAYNLGQRDDQWSDCIYPRIQELDEARNQAAAAIAAAKGGAV